MAQSLPSNQGNQYWNGIGYSKLDWVLSTNGLPVLVDQTWNWDHAKSHEAKEGVTPSISKGSVHLWSSQWQDASKNRSGNCEGGDGGRGVLWEGVDHVGLNWDKDTHHTEAERHKTDDWNYPVGLVVDGPSIPEEGDWDEAGEDDTGWEAHFWLEDTTVGERHLDDRLVGDLSDRGDAGEKSDSDTEVGETSDLWRPAVGALKDNTDGGKKEVEETVDESHVGGHECGNRGENQHLNWADDTDPEDRSWREWDVGFFVARSQLRLIHLLTKTLGLVAHQDAVVGLLIEKLNASGDDTACDK